MIETRNIDKYIDIEQEKEKRNTDGMRKVRWLIQKKRELGGTLSQKGSKDVKEKYKRARGSKVVNKEWEWRSSEIFRKRNFGGR